MKSLHRLHGEDSHGNFWLRFILERLNWSSLFAGAALGMAGVHLLATRPLIHEMRRLETRVGIVQSQVDQLAGLRDDAEQASALLGVLTEQRDQVQSARKALAEIDALSSDVAVQSVRAAEAGESLSEISDLNSRLIALRDQRELTRIALSEIEALQQDVADLADASTAGAQQIEATQAVLSRLAELNDEAADASARIDAAFAALGELQRIQDQVIASSEKAPAAAAQTEQLLSLQDTLAGLETLDTAAANADRLVTLNDRIGAVENLDGSAENADRLLELHDALVADQRLQLARAASNVEDLIRLQASIAGQTERLADSIESLELLSDFQNEFNGELAQIDNLRRQLTELILLQTTISRAMETLQPLAELGNVRRLNDEEVREVARDILERRRERMASGPSKYEEPAPQIDGPAVDIVVPEPPVEE